VNARVELEFLIAWYWQINVALLISEECRCKRNRGSFTYDRDIRIICGAVIRETDYDPCSPEFAAVYRRLEKTGVYDIEFFPTTVNRVHRVNRVGIRAGTNRNGRETTICGVSHAHQQDTLASGKRQRHESFRICSLPIVNAVASVAQSNECIRHGPAVIGRSPYRDDTGAAAH